MRKLILHFQAILLKNKNCISYKSKSIIKSQQFKISIFISFLKSFNFKPLNLLIFELR